MDTTSRTVSMVLSSLQCDILAKQDRLEKTINSDMELEFKALQIKDILKEIVLVELAIAKFQGLIEANNKGE